MNDDKARELLREVMRFRKGEGKYDFSKLEPYDEANALQDAWDYIEVRIQTLLYERDTYKDPWTWTNTAWVPSVSQVGAIA